MRDGENIFDTSTTLTEVEEPAGDAAGALPNDTPPPSPAGEPDYFAPNPAVGHADARRRALAVLGLVGGGIFMAILISAATGSGNDNGGSTLRRAAGGDSAPPGRTATIVAPEPASRPRGAGSVATPSRTSAKRRPRSHRGGRNAQRSARHRQRAEANRHPASPPPQPETTPETSYSPEPEPTYVPTEAAPEPPPSTTPSTSAPPRSSQQEFGIEP